MKILIVEDEEDLAQQLKDCFRREKFSVDLAPDGLEALNFVSVYSYDLILLDWMLPVIDGAEVLKRIRQKKLKTPVIMLTARHSIADKEQVFEVGADDYITKPFSFRELLARVRAAIRRSTNITESNLLFHGIELNPVSRVVTRDGNIVHLEPKEFNLLEFFMRHPNQIFSAEAILDRVWPSDCPASPESIRTYIKMLRRKLDSSDSPSVIKTIRGVGYRLEKQ